MKNLILRSFMFAISLISLSCKASDAEKEDGDNDRKAERKLSRKVRPLIITQRARIQRKREARIPEATPAIVLASEGQLFPSQNSASLTALLQSSVLDARELSLTGEDLTRAVLRRLKIIQTAVVNDQGHSIPVLSSEDIKTENNGRKQLLATLTRIEAEQKSLKQDIAHLTAAIRSTSQPVSTASVYRVPAPSLPQPTAPEDWQFPRQAGYNSPPCSSDLASFE